MFVERDGRMTRALDNNKKEDKEVMYMLPDGSMVPMSEYLASKDKKWVTGKEKVKKSEEKKEEAKKVKWDETNNFDKDHLKKLLDDAGVKYHHMTGLAKLTKIAKENNLL